METGFQGRSAITELLVVDEVFRDAVLQKMPTRQLQTVATNQGMLTMWQNGLNRRRISDAKKKLHEPGSKRHSAPKHSPILARVSQRKGDGRLILQARPFSLFYGSRAHSFTRRKSAHESGVSP